jgi:hypothetical protein
MAGFYDRMLPAAANKLGKKYGAQVERSEISAGTRPANQFQYGVERDGDYYFVVDQNGEREAQRFTNRTDAGAWARSLTDADAPKPAPAWSLKITPALRKAALEQGFPLFSIGGAAVAGAHQLMPVDHDPFNERRLEPVEHNPFTQ